MLAQFPFLLGGTFIEARRALAPTPTEAKDFPSFWEGLSLRLIRAAGLTATVIFPFLLGGTFIEATAFMGVCLCRARISLPFGRDFH